MIAYCRYTRGKMSINGASTLVGVVSLVNTTSYRRYYTNCEYWQPLMAKILSACSLPHQENVGQQCAKNFWFCIIPTLSWELLQTFLPGVLPAFIDQKIFGDVTAPF
jgi:hypothetical protein